MLTYKKLSLKGVHL